MKKALKIAGITLVAIVGVAAIVLAVVFWLVLTPNRLTPIVKEQAGKFISCQVHVDEVELTVFETFPNIGVRIKNLQAINPMPDAENDTLVSIEYCTIGLNIRELIKNNAIIVHQFHLKNGYANLFVDSAGKANYDVLQLDTSDTTESTFKIEKIDLQKVTIKNLNVVYTNIPAKIQAETKNLDLSVKGKMKDEKIAGQIVLKSGNTVFQLNDTVPLFASASGLETKFKGNFNNFNEINGLLQLSLNDVSFSINDTLYAKGIQLKINFPLSLLLDNLYFNANNTSITINEYKIDLNGNLSRNSENGNINFDMGFQTNTLDIVKILELLPYPIKSQLPKMDIAGKLKLNGKISGTYNDSLFPIISANVLYNNGKFAMDSIPFDFNDIDAKLQVNLDLNSRSKLLIHNLNAKTGKNTVKLSGTIDDLLNKLFFDVKANVQMALSDLKPVLPPEIKAKGASNTTIQAKFTMEQLSNLALNKMIFSGTTDLTDLDFVYNDSIYVKSAKTHIELGSPNSEKSKVADELLHTKIQSKDLKINMIDFLSAKSQDANLNIAMSNVFDTTKLLSVACDFDFDNLYLKMDTITVTANKPAGSILLTPSKRNQKNPTINYTYQNNSLSAQMGKDFTAQTQKINVSGRVSYNDKEEDLILKWNPVVKMDLQEGKLSLASFPTDIHIPAIKFDFSSRKFDIKESRIKIGNSDFSLTGMVTNINKYLRKTGLLKAELEFVSENTDVFQLMEYVNGMGNEVDTTEEGDPFMVPLGIDVTLNTTIKKVIVKNSEFQNLSGLLTIKDGVLVLEEMGFTSDAARMQLTAVYRSPRKNHLFAGIDFHLLDIDIAKLIEMIPISDTLVPMLKFFAGKAEFHLAVETYLKSNYDIKISTLRGATAISGQNLLITDNTIFPKIYNKLVKDKLQTKVDSLELELTLFKDEVELYPFLMSIDRYKAVIAGRHNLDKTYKYHISLVDPLRLGLDIFINKKGNFDYKPVPCKYPKLYRPGKENAVDKKILELKKIISDALKANVKE